MNNTEQQWTETIESKHSLFDLNLKEVWRYKDLVYMFVKRDFVSSFKQTILGPIWFFINPIFTTVVYLVIFGNIAKLSTDGAPKILFYLAGVTLWNYFSSCLNGTSSVFTSNAAIFGKVYFPRIITPISIVVSNLIKLGIQVFIFLVFYAYFYVQGAEVGFHWTAVFFPFLVLLMGVLGLGLGMIISSLVTKYRDFTHLIGFGVQLLMYLSAVMYPLALIEEKLPKYGWLVHYNPLAYIIETSRYMLLNVGTLSVNGLLFTFVVTMLVFFLGLLIFNRTEKSFIDTV